MQVIDRSHLYAAGGYAEGRVWIFVELLDKGEVEVEELVLTLSKTFFSYRCCLTIVRLSSFNVLRNLPLIIQNFYINIIARSTIKNSAAPLEAERGVVQRLLLGML